MELKFRKLMKFFLRYCYESGKAERKYNGPTTEGRTPSVVPSSGEEG